MKMYDYKVWMVPHKRVETDLKTFGAFGWHLVTAYLYDPMSKTDDRTVVILKKELEEDDDTTIQNSTQ